MHIFLQVNGSYDSDSYGGLFISILILFVIGFYFLPTIIAFIRKRHNKIAIAALNFLLGWSLIGWIIALIWSLSNNSPNNIIIHQSENGTSKQEDEFDKLSKLKRLLDDGAISQEEYDLKKQSLFR